MDFVHMLHDDRYLSKILCSTIPTPLHDLKVKITETEFLCLSFALNFLWLHYFQTLDGFCSYIVWWYTVPSLTPPTPPIHLPIWVTDLECVSDGLSEGCRFNPRQVCNILLWRGIMKYFLVILSLLPIQEGQYTKQQGWLQEWQLSQFQVKE